MRDTFSIGIEPRTEVALSVEFTDFHGLVNEPSEVVRFGGIAGCAIVSEATGVSTRAEAKAINRKAELSRESILLGQISQEEEKKVQLQRYKSYRRDLIQVCGVRAGGYAHSTFIIIGRERERHLRIVVLLVKYFIGSHEDRSYLITIMIAG